MNNWQFQAQLNLPLTNTGDEEAQFFITYFY